MIVPILIFAIPIVAILSNLVYKIVKLNYETPAENEDIEKLKKQIMYLEAEQETLHERIANLEQGERIEIRQNIKEKRSDFIRRDDNNQR